MRRHWNKHITVKSTPSTDSKMNYWIFPQIKFVSKSLFSETFTATSIFMEYDYGKKSEASLDVFGGYVLRTFNFGTYGTSATRIGSFATLYLPEKSCLLLSSTSSMFIENVSRPCLPPQLGLDHVPRQRWLWRPPSEGHTLVDKMSSKFLRRDQKKGRWRSCCLPATFSLAGSSPVSWLSWALSSTCSPCGFSWTRSWGRTRPPSWWSSSPSPTPSTPPSFYLSTLPPCSIDPTFPATTPSANFLHLFSTWTRCQGKNSS